MKLAIIISTYYRKDGRSNKTFGVQTSVVKNIIGDEPEIYVGIPSKLLTKN
jgi:hypothetical protein